VKKGLLGVAATIALAAISVSPAQAHRQWMLPSSTTLSGDDVWVTVDAAVSNDVFYFQHQPLRLDGVKAFAPDGTQAELQNPATGRYRSTFDLQLNQRGTWRIASMTESLSGTYVLNGKEERLARGVTTANLAERLPAGATDVKTSISVNRNETYVTVGDPTTSVFKLENKGIEFVPVTHPNDLVTGEAATFKFLLDGKPVAGLDVTVIPGGIRYRDDLGQQDLKTDAEGKVQINWNMAGMYWINVTTPRPEAGAAPAPTQGRAAYVGTFEVNAL
jgi:uncharacterized GH25 family protein